ncbi:hypothetical protein AAHT66_10215 [Bacillus inaquosorum]|uniref:hypothetical protein n=1 Tax=Bacillus sp. 0209A TaxID=3120562 RepID=UPI002FD92993
MKKIIIGLIAVFAVGVIGAVITAAASDFTRDEVTAAETYSATDIKKIEVTTSSMNAEVKIGQTDDIQVAAEGKVSDKSKKLFDVSQDGKSLKINHREYHLFYTVGQRKGYENHNHYSGKEVW